MSILPDDPEPPAPAQTPDGPGLQPSHFTGTPSHSGAAWLDPPGIGHASRSDSGMRARYHGPVHDGWGGQCHAHGAMTTLKMAFHADLRLHAGDAIDARLRGGGHSLDWVFIDDPDAGTASPVAADLHLWLGARLLGALPSARSWRSRPGGGAFIGSEDGERRPVGVRLRLDAQRPGPLVSRTSQRVQLPNRCWAPVPSRFVAGIHTHLDQAIHWVVGARVWLAPAGAASVRLHTPAATPQPAGPKPLRTSRPSAGFSTSVTESFF